jgi:hypothetical protein
LRAPSAGAARIHAAIPVEHRIGRERIVAREGEAWVHYGKDLRETKTIIGTGGVFVHNPHAAYILAQRSQESDGVQVLRPRNPQLYLDLSYSLYTVGLLSEKHQNVALQLFKSYIIKIS